MPRSATAARILAYLAQNPDAQDSLEGILNWWLPLRHLAGRTGRVKAALAELASEGLILEREAMGSPKRYRVNRGRLEEIRQIVRGRSS
ncbi:MAG: hypothetical protein V3T83_01800 [Acidobacteriota bacterium]